MKILVNTDVLASKTNDIKSLIVNFNAKRAYVKGDVSRAEDVWSGASYDNYEKNMTELDNDLLNLKNSVESYNNFIIEYNDEVIKLDEEYSGREIPLK